MSLWRDHPATAAQRSLFYRQPQNPKRPTQADLLISMLREAHASGKPLDLPAIMRAGIAQHGARFNEIRARGFVVENKIDRTDRSDPFNVHSDVRSGGRPMKRLSREPEIGWTYTPRMTPGDYPAYSRATKIYLDPLFKRWVCSVQFDVLTPDLGSVLGRLTWFLNMGDAEKPHAGRRSFYWGAWVIANGSGPKRSDRLSPRVFVNRHAVVLVGDTAKDFKQSSVGEDLAYSVIRNVLRWETGERKK